MSRQTVGIILAEPTNYDVIPFRYFILSLNKVQSIYEFCFPDIEVALDQCEYTEDQLLNATSAVDDSLSANFDYLIAIITRSIEGNLFFTSREKVAVITTDSWGKIFFTTVDIRIRAPLYSGESTFYASVARS